MLAFFLALAPAGSATGETGNGWSLETGDAPFAPRAYHSSAVFKDRMWVIGGLSDDGRYLNDSWYSANGSAWISATGAAGFTSRYGHATVVFEDRIWVVGGYDGRFRNDVWYSEDGVTWTEATGAGGFPPRHMAGAVVFADEMWIFGGEIAERPWTYANDTWHSYDGVTWSRARHMAPFQPRIGHASVVYGGRMWVIGGVGDAFGSMTFGDAWSSPDGSAWIRETGATGFSPRYYHSSVASGTGIWVIGGYDGAPQNDAWFSPDGRAWLSATGLARFSPRYGHTSLWFNDRLWVIGGYDGSYANDVWSAPDFLQPAAGLVITKSVSPRSVKQGKDAMVTIALNNTGRSAIHDIEIADTGNREFTVILGSNQSVLTSLGPGAAFTVTYAVKASEAGSFHLGSAAVMYADHEGNYHLLHSNAPWIEVIAPLFPATTAQPPFYAIDPLSVFLGALVFCLVIMLWHTAWKKG